MNNKYPGIKQLVISGYSDDTLSSGGLIKDEIDFLQKPFSVNLLLKTVRQILDKN